MGATAGDLCSACTYESLDVQVEPPVHQSAGEAEVLEEQSCSHGEKAIVLSTKGVLKISALESISRRASAASTTADMRQQSREAASEVTEVSSSSDMDISNSWSHQQVTEQHQQFCSEEINLASLAPDVPEVLPCFVSLSTLRPCWTIVAQSPEFPKQSRSVGTQAPKDRLPDLAPTAHTSIGEKQRSQQKLQRELQQEQQLQQAPVQELLSSPETAWPLLPSVGTWLVPRLLQTRSHSADMTTEIKTTVEAWHTLPSVGTWLHQPPRHCSTVNHSATSVSFTLHAKDLAEMVQDVEELKKVLIGPGVKPSNQTLKVDSLLAFDPYAPWADSEHGETFDGCKTNNGQDECPVS